ncbi:MAG: hypothetical protein IJA11_08785 [Oscillospiraceae bacterium]|nr:hypothetical protein [Oscillospiraceae bacterium]
MSKPITMEDVWFELRGLRAITEIVTVAMSEDCDEIQGRKNEDDLARIVLADRTEHLYLPALDHIHGCICALHRRTEAVTS